MRAVIRRRLAHARPFVIAAAIIAAGALIAWPLGGWDTVRLESTRIPEVDPGTLVAGQQFSVAIESAQVTSVHPDGFTEPEPGWEYLILEVTIVNETAETELSLRLGDSFGGVVTIDDGVAGWGTTNLDSSGYEADAAPYLVADGTYLPDLQPRLPATLQLVFEVPTGTWVPGQLITVGIVDRAPFESTLGTGIRYGSPRVIATVDVRAR